MGIIARMAGAARSIFGSRSKVSVGGSIRTMLGGESPGDWSSDHAAEARHFTGWVYIALNAICKSAAGATVTVNDSPPVTRTVVRKSVSGTVLNASTQGEPLPLQHPVMRLLNRPNPKQSGAAFRYEQAMQLGLTGTCLVVNFRRDGVTYERYVVPTSIAEPVRPSSVYPNGGYRITPRTAALRFDEDGFLMSSAFMSIIGQTLPAEMFTTIRWPHPFYKDDGLSPLSAGATWADLAAQVDEARFMHNKNAFNPSAIVSPPEGVSPDEKEITRVENLLNQKYAGAKNAGRIMCAAHSQVSVLGNTPREMAYEHGFEQLGSAIRALYSVSGSAVGLTEGMTYGSIAASLRQHAILAVQPYLDLIADEETEQLIVPEFGAGLKASYKAPTVDDPDLIERQLGLDLSAGTITRGEMRKIRGRPLFGDDRDNQIAGGIGLQEMQMAMQQQQMEAQAQMAQQQMAMQAASVAGSGAPGAEGGSDVEAEGEDAQAGQGGGFPAPPQLRRKTLAAAKTLVNAPTGYTMLVIPPEIAEYVLGFQEELDPADVLEVEAEPHVTVRYGVAGSVQDVQRAVAGSGPVAVTLGVLGAFQQPDRDVLYINVDGGTLRRLRDRIENGLTCAVDSHGEYRPHVTIAYLKPGTAEKYLEKSTGLEETPLAFRELAYNPGEGGGSFRVGLVGMPSAAGVQLAAPTSAPVGVGAATHPSGCRCEKCRTDWLDGAINKTLQAARIWSIYQTGKAPAESPKRPEPSPRVSLGRSSVAKTLRGQFASRYKLRKSFFSRSSTKETPVVGRKGQKFSVVSVAAREGLVDKDGTKFPQGVRSVYFDSRSNKWHVPTTADEGVYHSDYDAQLFPDIEPKDTLHLVKGYWRTRNNEVELYDHAPIADTIASEIGAPQDYVERVMSRSMERALKNPLKFNGAPATMRARKYS